MWRAMLVTLVAVTVAPAAWAQDVNLPLGGGASGIEGLKPAPLSGVTVTVEEERNVDGGRPALRAAFNKPGEERRLVALEAAPKGDATGARALVVRYRLSLKSGQAPRLALVVFDQSGNSWYRVGGEPMATDGFTDGRLSVAALHPTAFTADPGAELAWEGIGKVWLGIVIDGAAEGTLELSGARFTGEPYVPTKPLRATGDGPGTWSAGQDPRVTSTMTTPNEGREGQPCMKYEFHLPGGSHMYAIPSTPVLAADLEGYTGLQFTYKATIPQGINGLLVCVGEADGTQYYVDPPPAAAADWTTITIPWEQFKFATWTQEENGKLDLEQISRVFIGCHGAAAGAGGEGVILAQDIEFVP